MTDTQSSCVQFKGGKMISDVEKLNNKIKWIRTGFLHGKEFDSKNPVVNGYNLSDENLLQILNLLNKYRNEEGLNDGLEYIKTQSKQNFWLAYYSLDEKETKEYDRYFYAKSAYCFIRTKIQKAKVLGKLDECSESIKQHRINENKIFESFIKECEFLTDDEKDQVLS